MAAKSILQSGNTTFLSELQNGTAALQVQTLSINSVVLGPGGSGIIQTSGALQPNDIVDNSGSIGTPGQVLAKAPTGTDMLWTSYPLFTAASPLINLTIPGGQTTTSGTAFTIPYGVDNTDPDAPIVYRVGTYLFTYTLIGYTATGDGLLSVSTQLTADITSGGNPIPYLTGNINSLPNGLSITGSQVITFTASQFGNIEITITLNGAATNTLNVPEFDMTLTVIQIA